MESVAKPVVVEIDSGGSAFETFRALAHAPHPFFLDSAADLARCDGAPEYSIVGCDPFLTMSVHGETVTLRRARERDGFSRDIRADPFDALDDLLLEYRCHPAPGLPFCGGAVGYLSYDLCRFVECLPCTVTRDLDVPDMFFCFYDAAVVFEHGTGSAFVVSNGLPERGAAGLKRARERAGWLRELIAARRVPAGVVASRTAGNAHPAVGAGPGGRSRPARSVFRMPATEATNVPRDARLLPDTAGLRSNLSRDAYLAAVDRAREYIFAGDIYQVNLSQRFEAELHADPISLYGALRDISPAPFGAYVDAGRFKMLSNSPERFLRVSGSRVETRPIKGTLPRGEDEPADLALSERLLASEKDAAEHLMIVDLERNDLGRICEFGSVVVDELARLESFRHVHHLVSVISGKLRPGVTAGQLLRATFPGGSITGAPKVRAMEIIDELEPTARGVYTGAIGYLSCCGSIDLSIAIRTLVYDGTKAYFQVGGGVVADSDPEAEYQETLDKAGAFFDLLSSAEPEKVRQ